MKHWILSSFCVLILMGQTLAQSGTGIVHGLVKGIDGPIPGAAVYVKGSGLGTQTDQHGKYNLKLPAGTHTITIKAIGFEVQHNTVEVKPGQKHQLHAEIKESQTELEEVTVTESSVIEQVRESAYNVVALDAKKLHNSTLSLSQALNKASGIKIRESGGVGSDASVTLNGFRGRNVKIFMDGVPMQGFGSAFQLNNIPVNLAERIEVYKGVVPIEFGADAMGGVINIVTNQSPNTYLDASYSYGSFNTHKTNIVVNHTTKSGFYFRVNAFQNYSDNNYKVKTKVLTETGNYTLDEHWVERFHDKYHNETVMARMGFVNKSWADQIFLGLTLGQEYNEVQNSSLLQFVYGQRLTKSQTILPSFFYQKNDLLVKGLDVRLTANYNLNYNDNIDTSTSRYNWFGDKLESNTVGEVGVNTLSKYKNKNASSTANITYAINPKHSIAVNNVITVYERKMSTDVALTEELTALDTLRRYSLKSVTGLSYRYSPSENWNFNLFAKNYYQKSVGPYDQANSTSHPEYVEATQDYSTQGLGLAATYFFRPFQLKASVERAYRLPTERELFGDEVLESANSSLRAENSMNYNLGLSVNKNINRKHSIYADVTGYYRDTKDFIRRVQEQRFGTMGNINHGQVRNIGVDGEVRYSFKNKFTLGGTVTYMDMRNKERYRTGTGSALSGTYDNRMPNIPYFFGNADAGYMLNNVFGKGNMLSFNYTFNFVNEYYLLWESQGNASTKATLPRQMYHDLAISWMTQNGRYNISLEANNFTNELLYDNFSLQKPGRSFNIKFRYFLMKKGRASKRK